MNSLELNIKNEAKNIIIDQYAMSLGEIMSIYEAGEMDIHPEFQREYRWSPKQKSSLIESILLGYPIPPIFVSQKTDNLWDVIDGQQRLSTILEFTGLLKDENNTIKDPLKLVSTKFLNYLDDVAWDSELFSQRLRIQFKRSRLDFIIVKEQTDDDNTKLEIFERLNTGGVSLTDQEIRNGRILLSNKQFYYSMLEMSKDENFIKTLPLSQKQKEEAVYLRYITLFIIYNNIDTNLIKTSDDMEDFLNEEITKIAMDKYYNFVESISVFTKVFKLLCNITDGDTFKNYDKEEDKFSGAVNLSSFEAIVPGLTQNIAFWEKNEEVLLEKIKLLHEEDKFKDAKKQGVRALQRAKVLIDFSRDWFNHENS